MEYLPSDHIRFSESRTTVVFLNQAALPNHVEWKQTADRQEMYDAIQKLEVRGAPAIGIFAAYCLAVLAKNYPISDIVGFGQRFHEDAQFLVSSRPTAVNLSWATGRMENVFLNTASLGLDRVKAALDEEALRIHEEDIGMCSRIAENGLSLLRAGDGILTHCNAGPLATSRYGTALGPILLGQERGYNFHVYADETRPLLQGARLTAFELSNAGVDTTLICDNMAGLAMRQGKIQAVLVGCDRVARNGDMANKIGTSQVAVLAAFYQIPFYVCCPASTFDGNIATGNDIIIEERDPEEIRSLYYKEPMAPMGVKCFNPAFDVTDHRLVSAYITDRGVIRPPFSENLASTFT